MTGQYPARHCIHQHLADHGRTWPAACPTGSTPGVMTVPKLLKTAGYATAHFGKWHLGSGNGAPDSSAYGIDDHRTMVFHDSTGASRIATIRTSGPIRRGCSWTRRSASSRPTRDNRFM